MVAPCSRSPTSPSNCLRVLLHQPQHRHHHRRPRHSHPRPRCLHPPRLRCRLPLHQVNTSAKPPRRRRRRYRHRNCLYPFERSHVVMLFLLRPYSRLLWPKVKTVNHLNHANDRFNYPANHLLTIIIYHQPISHNYPLPTITLPTILSQLFSHTHLSNHPLTTAIP